MTKLTISKRRAGALATVVLVTGLAATTTGSEAQTTAAPQASFPVPGAGFGTAPLFRLPGLPAASPITPNGEVVEDVVARVNDQVITRTEYARAQEGLVQEAKQENWTESEFEEKQHDLLRDMIDQQLLISKGKDLGISGDAETMRQLDEIRKRANLPDLAALQKAAEQQGVSFEDFKQNVRNQAITQQVVREEVGKRINITPSEEQTYYKQHAQEFQQPEQVHLSEILVPTPENATDAQVTEAQTKADAVEAKLKSGANFAEVAKASSGGPTASAGGDLGDFKRGTLGDVLEKATFGLPAGQFTEPIRTRQGYVILRVDSHQAAGTPPIESVEGQVQEAIYMSQLQPALRSYLTQAREDAFLEVKPGFTDTGSVRSEAQTKYSTYTPPPLKKKIVKKQRAEQERAVHAEKQLAEAREKLALKQQARAAAKGGSSGGVTNAAAPRKRQKIRREKVRFGQAPRTALPAGSLDVASVPSLGTGAADADKALGGQAPGAAMASPTQSLTTISTGTGGDNNEDALLTPKTVSDRKTRFSQRVTETNEKKAEVKVASAETIASKRPTVASAEESADEKVQASPLGLDTGTKTKHKKSKRAKDEPKERLQSQPKPVETTPTVAPTVNPVLGTSATGSAPAAANSTDRTALPPATPTPPNPAAQDQPIPSVTSASPGAANTTAQPPQ